MAAGALEAIQAEVVACRACPRLVAWRERVARERRRAFRDEVYWGRPVPSFGDPDARLLVVGLAPAAHGANRTGRMFTGDESGDWLFRALHRAGLASAPTSTNAGDGLALRGCLVTSPVRCAPPGNRPAPDELARCLPWLAREIEALPRLRVVVCLGGFGWQATLRALAALGHALPRPRPRFGHLAVAAEGLPVTLVGSYHPSRLNTRTGRLTEAMLDAAFAEARRHLDADATPPARPPETSP